MKLITAVLATAIMAMASYGDVTMYYGSSVGQYAWTGSPRNPQPEPQFVYVEGYWVNDSYFYQGRQVPKRTWVPAHVVMVQGR